MKLLPHIRIWLSTDFAQDVIGTGRYRLLRTIGELGSLSAAAEQLGISYRKAWDDLKKAEKSIGCRLISKSRGGSGGGGKTELTADGIRLIGLYEQFAGKVERFAMETFNTLAKEIGGGQEHDRVP